MPGFNPVVALNKWHFKPSIFNCSCGWQPTRMTAKYFAFPLKLNLIPIYFFNRCSIVLHSRLWPLFIEIICATRLQLVGQSIIFVNNDCHNRSNKNILIKILKYNNRRNHHINTYNRLNESIKKDMCFCIVHHQNGTSAEKEKNSQHISTLIEHVPLD